MVIFFSFWWVFVSKFLKTHESFENYCFKCNRIWFSEKRWGFQYHPMVFSKESFFKNAIKTFQGRGVAKQPEGRPGSAPPNKISTRNYPQPTHTSHHSALRIIFERLFSPAKCVNNSLLYFLKAILTLQWQFLEIVGSCWEILHIKNLTALLSYSTSFLP